jgi:hypothetical protein
MSSYKDYRLSLDTTPETEDLIFELLSKKSPAEKLQMVSQMSSAMRTLALSGLRDRYSNESALQLKIRLADLLYGAAIAEGIAERLKNSERNE